MVNIFVELRLLVYTAIYSLARILERWVVRRWASIPVRLVVVPGGLRGINNAHSEMQCAHAEATMISFCTVFAYASAWDARQAKRCAMRRCRDKLWVKIRYINFLQKSRHFIFLSNSAHWVILIPFSSFYLYRVFLTHIFVLRRSFRVLCSC